jgi:hypothetical protein
MNKEIEKLVDEFIKANPNDEQQKIEFFLLFATNRLIGKQDQIRLETLKEVLPEKMTNEGHPYASKVHNECRQEIINKAKAKWGIIL